MHSLLQIPELVRLIVGSLSKSDQENCTQVCRLWSEVALDSLWHSTSLLKIARLLAPVRITTTGASHYIFKHLPSPNAWPRFESMYSQRVKVLSVGWDGDGTVLLKGVDTVRPPSLRLLPNLKRLVWKSDGYCDADPSEALAFLHTEMEGLFFFFGEQTYPKKLVTLMEAIPLRCPSLTSLEMDASPSEELLNSFVSLVTSLPHLVDVKIPPFPNIFRPLQALTNRPSLRSLRICLHSGSRSCVRTFASPGNMLTGGFPLLEVLEVNAQNHTTIYPLFQIDTHCLHSIHMVICTLDGSVSPRNLLQSISRSCPVLTRLQLDYRQYHFNETQFNDGAVNFDDLRSILACTSMTYLHVMVLLALNLSDSDVLDMAQAWPRLRSLELGSCNHTTENAKHLSLSSLFILTRHCPDIKCITLDINAGVSEGFLAETGTGRVARLDSLNVGHYIPESDGEAFLARLLGQICEPQCRLNYLENRRLTDKSHEELRSRWENVKMLIRHFSELYSTIRSLELENASLRALAR